MNSFKEHVVLIPVEAKDVAPAVGDPQSIINEKAIDGSDILVSIFWTRLGSPAERAESGTVEEIERSIEKGKRVMLYFSSADLPQKLHNTEQWQGVKTIKRRYKEKCLVHDYSTPEEFNRKFREDISRTIDELHSKKDTSNTKTTDNWIEDYKEKYGQLPLLPDYLLPMVNEGYSQGKPMSKELRLSPVGAQGWYRLLPSQRKKLLELADWLGIGAADYMSQSRKGWPARVPHKKTNGEMSRSNGKALDNMTEMLHI